MGLKDGTHASIWFKEHLKVNSKTQQPTPKKKIEARVKKKKKGRIPRAGPAVLPFPPARWLGGPGG